MSHESTGALVLPRAAFNPPHTSRLAHIAAFSATAPCTARMPAAVSRRTAMSATRRLLSSPFSSPATRSFSSAAASAEVVIVGSGIMGLNIAYQLRRRDPAMKITVLERASALGFGSSGYSTGFQRAYYSFDETMGPLAWSKSASWQRHRSPRVL